MADRDYSDSAGLMWPATFDGSEAVEDPHCTIMFLGDASALRVSPAYILSAMRDFLDAPGEVPVTGPEVFGNEEKVWVATLDTSVLNGLQAGIQEALAAIGVENQSSFPDYRPHVTIMDAKDETLVPPMPDVVVLGEPQVWLGKERYIAIR